MSIIFFGSPDFAVPTLKALIHAKETIAAVVTQPDRPRGRSGKSQPCAVKACALEHGIKAISPLSMKDETFMAELKSYKPEFFVVVAYGKILTPALLCMPSIAPINVHASLLPAYRGAAPVTWSIMDGDTIGGVTTMLMDEGLDTGDILLQKTLTIDEADTTGTLSVKLSEAGGPLLIETLESMRQGTLKPRPQGETTTKYARMLTKQDGHVDWTKAANKIHNMVRALSPWPSAYCFVGKKRLKLIKTSPVDAEGVIENPSDAVPATVTAIGKDYFDVATGNDGMLRVHELQPEGKRAMSAKDYLLGHSVEKGTLLQ